MAGVEQSEAEAPEGVERALTLDDGSRLADHLHTGRALLLDPSDDPGLRAHADGHGDRVTVLTSGCADRPELAGLLVRPDGYVAWAADREDGRGMSPADALEQWFGTPAAV